MPRQRVEPRQVLAIASVGGAVAFVDATIVNIAFPDIAHSFRGTSIASLSWVLNAYNIVFAAFLIAAGRIADVVGRRRIFVGGLEVFTLASLLCALAPSAEALIAFRVLQAIGAAMVVPSSLALVLNAFPVEQRAHGVALLSAVAAAAAGLGPSLGGLLVAADNWRLVFLVNLPLGVTAIVLGRRHLVESRSPGRRRMPDATGALLLAASVAALVLGVVKGQEWGWGSAPTVACFAVALCLAVLLGQRCRWHRAPVLDLALLRTRGTALANAMTVIAAAGFYGYTLSNVLFLTGVWRYSVLQAGLSLTPGPFVAAAVAGPASRLVQRFGYRTMLVAGGLIWGGAVMWFVENVGVQADFLGEWLPGIVMLGIGAGILFPNLSAAAVASTPGDGFGTATGLNSVSRQVGAALGVAIVVAIIGHPTRIEVLQIFRHAWAFGAGCLFAAGLGSAFVGRLSTAQTPSLSDAREALRAIPATLETPVARRRARRAVRLARDSTTPLRPQSAAEFLGHVPLLAGLDAATIDELAKRTRDVRLAAGEWLFHEGEAGEAMYIVRGGRIEVIDESAGVLISELGRGDVLGELALLTSSPRSASVRAARSTELLEIRRPDFERLLLESPAASFALNRALAEQLRATHSPVSRARALPATVALLGLDDGVPADAIGQALIEALHEQTSALLVDYGSLNADVEPSRAVWGPLLDRAESEADLVVLLAGTLERPSAWTEFCLQQADRILAISSGVAPRPGRERSELRGCDLVGYDIELGSGRLSQWAEQLQPVESHLIRSNRMTEDLARLARRLTGRSIGIVLSGGGARAFSHIGVLEVLSEAGIVIDRVAGVSMGAYIGALFAMGLDLDEIDSRCFEAWVQRRPLSDYTVPRHALIRGERVEAMLRRTFPGVAIEELPRSFLCAYTELRRGELVIARSGPLDEAVGFSMCLPIIAPPQVRGPALFVDGSLIDNLPVGVMAELGEGPIIAVDVKATLPDARDAAEERANGRRPRPDLQRPPGLGETLTRVLLLGSANTSESARRHADLIISPNVDGVGLLEFHQLDAAREAGRVAAQQALESDVVSRTLS